MSVLIQNYTSDKAKEITDVFCRAVHAIDASIYSEAQKQAWAPKPPNYANWLERLNQKRPMLAIKNGTLAGFIELEGDGHIDCLYVAPEFQRQGIAEQLYRYVWQQAKAKKLPSLYVDASFLAKPFFEKMGFSVVRKNKVQRGSVILENFSMVIALDS